MKKEINVLVVDDNRYFNDLLSRELRECVKNEKIKRNFKFVFHPFTDPGELAEKVRSHDFSDKYSIAFIDYYLGNGINGSHIIKMLKEENIDTTIVLLSHSGNVKGKVNPGSYDYFISKDSSATALCCLCLEQYLENIFLVPMD